MSEFEETGLGGFEPQDALNLLAALRAKAAQGDGTFTMEDGQLYTITPKGYMALHLLAHFGHEYGVGELAAIADGIENDIFSVGGFVYTHVGSQAELNLEQFFNEE